MAAITNTYQTFTTKGIREDLSNIIYNISPTDTPFMSGVGKTKATNTLHEWQTDSLASAANYINRIGWRKGEPCFYRVKLTNKINQNKIRE